MKDTTPVVRPSLVHGPWHRKFQGLMPHRVGEILLLSSAYDAFVLEEDGTLSERLMTGFSELSLTWAPRITHVTTAAEAMRQMARRRFDMVITVVQVEDSDAAAFSRRVKEEHSDIPVVLLVFDEGDVRHFPDGRVPDSIERTFLWTGDASTILAAVKLIEDLRNVGHDTSTADVQVILVVEDHLRTYSAFLGLLYPELLSQSHSMIAEGTNHMHRVMRMRARPKILLANDYDEARIWYSWFRDHLLALITDVRFPKGGVEKVDAGYELAREIREDKPDLPVLILSSEEDLARRADELDACYIEKRSPDFHTQVRRFLRDRLGFGDFVFRLENGEEVNRAHNVYEMEQAISRIPDESLALHSRQHDFSVWLKARCFLDCAAEIRARSIEDFDGLKSARDYLVGVLRRARDREQEGMISDVSAPPSGSENRFVRIGSGSIGGKARGLAFVNSLIVERGLLSRFPDLQIRIPRSVALATDAFERFMDANAPSLAPSLAEAKLDDWLAAKIDPALSKDLENACFALKGPLAIRSSNVLEDSRFQPFAGVYATYMLPNTHPHPRIRMREIKRAIKAIYASVFSKTAQSYVAGTPHGLDEQRMGVVIQQVVGARYGARWYPLLSGVAQSRNYYPVGAQRTEEGVALIALGLGETVVRGGTALRFSPACPQTLPQFPNAQAFSKLSQTQFYSLNLSEPEVDLSRGPSASLTLDGLDVAEADGTLAAVGSVYSVQDDMLRDNLKLRGPRVVTFNNILRWNALPVAEVLSELLDVLKDAMGGDVEIEFAVDVAPQPGRQPRFYVLQLRPMPPQQLGAADVDLDTLPPGRVLISTDRSLGHGCVGDVRDVVYVQRGDLTAATSRATAAEVRSITASLDREDAPYMLIGPGRWGTSDPTLGIPVDWRDIARARVIVETPLDDRHVEPSQGTHFFHNVTAMRIGYLTLSPGERCTLDIAWLDAQPAATESPLVRHVRLDTPLVIRMDGRLGRAVVLKPER